MKTKKLVTIALFAAFVCISTMAITIPSSTGYIHMGDTIVLLGAYLLGPINGAIAAGIGSAIADAFAGYTVFIIPTLIIKSVVALSAGFIFSRIKHHSFLFLLLYGVIGEFFMVLGYFVTELLLSGSLAVASVGIYGSLTQAIFGIICSSLLFKLLAPISTIKKYLN